MFFLFKLILLLLVFVVSSLIGFLIANRYSKRVKELEDFLLSLELFETKITYTYDDLIETFTYISENLKTKIYRIYFITAEKLRENVNMSAGDIFRNVVDEERIFLELNAREIETIKNLSVSLGQLDVESQIKNIKLTSQMTQTLLQNAYEENRKNFKLYRNMGMLGGLVLIILLI